MCSSISNIYIYIERERERAREIDMYYPCRSRGPRLLLRGAVLGVPREPPGQHAEVAGLRAVGLPRLAAVLGVINKSINIHKYDIYIYIYIYIYILICTNMIYIYIYIYIYIS